MLSGDLERRINMIRFSQYLLIYSLLVFGGGMLFQPGYHWYTWLGLASIIVGAWFLEAWLS